MILNVNVGVLGHVDSGKTSLAKALSTVASTAAFDKNPQSKERGITLDLGFSSFKIPAPPALTGVCSEVQYTLVDCPGHASLIRTIIGGAQIIDLMLLVIDVTKGIQTQTAECLILGEITADKMILVLNKIDTLPQEKRASSIEKLKKNLRGKVLSKTRFKDAPIIEVAAKNGDEGDPPIGLDHLIDQLKALTSVPERNPLGPFLFSVDHCFSIRGQGTVMTGTVLQGSVAINDMVEIVSLKEVRKVKGIQMFKSPVQTAAQGDRIGLCVTQFDAKLLERGLVCKQGIVPLLHAGIINLEKVPYFKGDIATNSKFHISLGHETVLGKITLFQGRPDSKEFSMEQDFKYVDSLAELSKDEESEKDNGGPVYALIEFEHPINVVPGCKVLGSKLDTDIHSASCRLAFHGHILVSMLEKNYMSNECSKLKVYKTKSKEGICERANNDSEVICRNMFKKETNLAVFNGLKVTLSSGDEGTIDGSFGQSGKFKVRIPKGLKPDTLKALKEKKKKEGDGEPIKVFLSFKRYVFNKEMVQ